MSKEENAVDPLDTLNRQMAELIRKWQTRHQPSAWRRNSATLDELYRAADMNERTGCVQT